MRKCLILISLAWIMEGPAWAGNFSHLNVLDFARGAKYLDPATAQQAFTWLATHIDVYEGHDATMASINPASKSFTYQLDLSMCMHVNCGISGAATTEDAGLTEDFFLHFSQDTQIQFYDLSNNLVATVTIPGCPSPNPMIKACRAQAMIWDDSRWIMNYQTLPPQQWKAAQLLAAAQGDQGVFLDEHSPDYRLSFTGGQTITLSGGGIREYGGINPSQGTDPNNWTTPGDLDKAYITVQSAWLQYLRSRFQQAGKFVFINTASESTFPLAEEQILAAGGFSGEMTFRADIGKDSLMPFFDLFHQLTAEGGMVDMLGSSAYYGPSGYTAGNYADYKSRYLMSRLVLYYVLKEPQGSPGIVYFNPTFYIDFADPGQGLNFESEWQKGFEVNVGQPLGDDALVSTSVIPLGSAQSSQGVTIAAEGVNAGSGDPTCSYQVFAREYTNALVLFRPQDNWNCTVYGDPSAVQVTLPKAYTFLAADGTQSPAITTISVHNAEGVVLMNTNLTPDTTPPGAPRGVKVL